MGYSNAKAEALAWEHRELHKRRVATEKQLRDLNEALKHMEAALRSVGRDSTDRAVILDAFYTLDKRACCLEEKIAAFQAKSDAIESAMHGLLKAHMRQHA